MIVRSQAEEIGPRTVVQLMKRLEDNGMTYAVLRNYENFPHFSHDVDLAVERQTIAEFREIAVSLASQEGWDVLTECDHFAKSPVTEFRIEIFRFYRYDPPAYLHVDLFHGFLILGLPFFSENELLSTSGLEPGGRFKTLDRAVENTFRLLQIHKLSGNQDNSEKIERYRKRIIEYMNDHRGAFRQQLEASFGPLGLQAVARLEASDMAGLEAAMTKIKQRYFLRYLGRNPIKALKILAERLRDLRRIGKTDQCGLVFRIRAKDEAQRKHVRSTFDMLAAVNMFTQWTAARADESKICKAEHRIMLRCGIVVKWTDQAHQASFNFDTMEACDLPRTIIDVLVSHHPVILRRGLTP